MGKRCNFLFQMERKNNQSNLEQIMISKGNNLLPTCFKVEAFSIEVWNRIASGLMDWIHVDNEVNGLLTSSKKEEKYSFEVDEIAAVASLKYHELTEAINIDVLYPETKKAPSIWDPCSGFYFHKKSSKWIQLHCNFVHHRKNAQLFLVGDKSQEHENRESFAKAVRESELSIDELEKKLNESGAIAAVVRPPISRPKSCLVRTIDVLSQGSDANGYKQLFPREDCLDSSFAPLKGVRVVDNSRVLAGPTMGQTLAWFGADVLQVCSQNLP